MSLVTRFTRTLAVPILTIAAFAHSAAAQDLYFDGLLHHPLGSATLDASSPLVHQLTVSNIGSSGNDGVSVDLPASGRGHSFAWNSLADLGAPSSHTVELRGISGGVGAVVSAGSVRSDRVTAEAVDLTPDFSGVGATRCWVVLTDESGGLVKRVSRPLPFTLHLTPVSPAVTVVERRMQSVQSNPLYRSIVTTFEGTVHATFGGGGGGGGGGFDCHAVSFVCDTGDPVVELTSVQMTAISSSGVGSVSIEQEGIVPPCAGCPNGPTDDDVSVARGDARYGGPGGGLTVTNLGSSGEDGASWIRHQSAGLDSPDEASITITDADPASALTPGTVDFDSYGTLSGTPGHPLGHLSCTVEGDEWSFVPDFSPIGATGYRAALYLNGALVTEVDNPASGVRKWGDGHVTLMKITDDSEEYRIICITHPCPGSTVSVGGTDYLVDEVRLQPLSSVPLPKPDNVTSMEMRTTNVTTLTIAGMNFHSSQPNVSVEPRASGVDLAARLSPNPASGPVSVVFALPRAEHARVSVIDVAGREVRGLADADFAAGAHRMTWDGRDGAGHLTPSGIYFVRVETGTAQRVTRVARLW